MDADEPDDAAAARWLPLMEQLRCSKLRIPIIGEPRWLVISRSKGAFTLRRAAAPFIHAELRLLRVHDMSWDDVETLLGDQMVFLPIITGRRPFLWTGQGFEPKIMVGGLHRLLRMRPNSPLELHLNTAACLAGDHACAIEVKH